MIECLRYGKSDDRVVQISSAVPERARWLRAPAAMIRAFPRELRLEPRKRCRVCRVSLRYVLSALSGELRVVPRKLCLSSPLWEERHFYFVSASVVSLRTSAAALVWQSVIPSCKLKENGLPRRFAPRNDITVQWSRYVETAFIC